MKKVLLWVGIPVILVTAYFSAKDADVPRDLPEIPDTSGFVEPAIVIAPERIQQGEPALITVSGTSTVTSLTWNSKSLDTFIYKGSPSALVGIDIKAVPGTYPVVAALADGTRLSKNVIVGKRTIITAPLGIPDSLGGNTPQAANNLVTTLAQENAILASVPTESRKLWGDEFIYPIEDPVVTDEYGYTRSTVNTSISHKGTDFRAPVGTPVYAMSDGVVRLAREFRNYGNTVVIDHGFGVQTLYMHLSELGVEAGETVNKGELIGKSGKTGYAEFPHLHISIKIGGISIDPVKFIGLF